MKKHILLSALALVMSAGFSATALADDAGPTADATKTKHHHHKHHGFSEGLCIGQVLAQQGVILPAQVAGQKTTYDAATKAAFEVAKQSCRAQRPTK